MAFTHGGSLSALSVAAVQATLDSAVAVLVLVLGMRAGAWKGAVGAALLYGLHPGAISMAGTILSDALFTALLTATLGLVAAGWLQDRLAFTGVAGMVLGVAILCRPVILLLPIILALVAVVLRSLPRARRYASLLVMASIVVVAPWAARCTRLTGSWTTVQTAGSVNIYLPTRWDWDQRDQGRIWAMLEGDPCGIQLRSASTPAAAAAADRFCMRDALRNVAQHPFQSLRSRTRTLPHLFLSSYDSFTGFDQSFGRLLAQGAAARLLIKLALLTTFSLVPLIIAASALVPEPRRLVVCLCGTVFLFFAVVHVPLWIEHRFWLPALPSSSCVLP